jgi:hypothetical protein
MADVNPDGVILEFLNPKVIISVDMPIAYLIEKSIPVVVLDPAPTQSSAD